jgi:hypothetical protein
VQDEVGRGSTGRATRVVQDKVGCGNTGRATCVVQDEVGCRGIMGRVAHVVQDDTRSAGQGGMWRHVNGGTRSAGRGGVLWHHEKCKTWWGVPSREAQFIPRPSYVLRSPHAKYRSVPTAHDSLILFETGTWP